ncbi:hypothetical protein, conserved [Eimeria brunetti]|uniref:Uncharacterized protein n=1 Tax=Eimeria brunetti TaxID=51314 RepID=U6LQI9_9EIME|nr:hypothetical protein, conserved [Eimeria brunetti]
MRWDWQPWGPRAFWWVGYNEVVTTEIAPITSGNGVPVPKPRRRKKVPAQKRRETKEPLPNEQQQQHYRSSVRLQLHRGREDGGEASSTDESDEETVERQQPRRYRNSLQMQLQRERGASGDISSDSSDEETQRQQQTQPERQRRQRYRNSVHMHLQRDVWRPKAHPIPEDSDEEETQGGRPLPPERAAPAKQKQREAQGMHSGSSEEAGVLSESDWSDGEHSEDEGQAEAAAGATPAFRGQILPQNLEGSSLPASVVNRAVKKINMRYEQCGETAREMTRAEEELIDSVIQRWESTGFQPFDIEGMTVDSEEQKIILHNEALTPNLVNIYLRALEINKTPLTNSKRKRPKQTSLPVEVASKLLSPTISAEDSEHLLAAMEIQRVLDAHITVFPVMKSPMHYSTLTLDTIRGDRAVLFLLRWFDPFGESGTIPMQNLLPLLKRLADMHGLRFSSLYRTNFASEPTINTNNDSRDSGVLCCMLATQLAEGCSPVASEGDALYFRKQMLLKLDFAGRWRRAAAEDSD